MGRAFQLTNMIRDIDEDYDLGRQYIPEDICEKYDININKRDYTQKNWSSFMEHLFLLTEKYYISADIGIKMIDDDVREIINIARIMYYKIHDKGADGDCFFLCVVAAFKSINIDANVQLLRNKLANVADDKIFESYQERYAMYENEFNSLKKAIPKLTKNINSKKLVFARL